MENTTRIFGIRAVIEAIESGETIEKIFIQKGLSGNLFQELNRHLKSGDFNISYVPVEKLNKLSKGNHQGVIANISPIQYISLEELVERNKEGNPLYLLLDGLTDVRNFGAIIRTAECCGVSGIIIPTTGAAPVNADTIKTSAGAVFRVPIARVNHIKDALFHLQTYDIQVVAATEKTDQSIYDIDLKKPTAIVMGNEAKGVSNSILKSANQKASLPMLGEIASLNVSVACGAILYEAVRQRI
ncbi:23S rRNA (guanosine(2251)-2'-O)-methyltransferase RlmB [Christiangramia flava]|uniref:23S rRNA (Guanosine-2'-O-)-methyltransferase rlmB n=1 Tax=Christiangramia flava JLT2011 TaxID=1229726 RepID=A0A1L7I1N8_9FLAO|nr:23S rRNA (guanosine(2251)-2'-O)-methyltransferase RlmB [Christiangramia flava]APU67527.1 23S rRNA (guanosine-2'-O-) -methyltransferase rlmB [Christiangramia flava JLT2011]OSS40113.1 23S rRNA (guanosine-2'-O-) -methyltransferase rlmB [Christiangramia flava JLT2011]